MKKILPLSLLVFIIYPAVAQKTTLQFSAFDQVEVFGPFDVTLVKSETEYAEVDFKGIDEKDIVYEVHKGVLKFKLRHWHYLNDHKDHKFNYISVKLYYNDIDRIEAAAGAIVRSSEQLKSKYLRVDCSMGAEVTLDIFAWKVKAASTMGGLLRMGGQTEFMEARAATGGVLRAPYLESKTVYVKATTGASVFVNAQEELEAFANLGASINYTGGPSVRHTSRNFGGEISHKKN